MNAETAGKTYIAIDLKSFYASVECVLRGFDPLTTNLVVADESRTEKTICLAVSPSLKAYGIPGRARLFEVNEAVRRINAERLWKAPGKKFSGKSCFVQDIEEDPTLELDFITAMPGMRRYMEWSSRIYGIYMRFISPEDMHVYSVDEVFIDATGYLKASGKSAREFARELIRAVFYETGITATAGIGPNLYLAKIAMDIGAKKMAPDENGARIAELTVRTYRETLWEHTPITDFWRIGAGYAKKLRAHGMYTMGDVARCSLTGEDLLFDMFGINAELLIDHAWGIEPCTIADIKAYKPENKSLMSGQVLQSPYTFAAARLVISEMADSLSLDLKEKGLKTKQLALTVGYDIENLTDPVRREAYTGEIVTDRYGRQIPKNAHGTIRLEHYTASSQRMIDAVLSLYDRIMDRNLLVRRMYLSAEHIFDGEATGHIDSEQLSLFDLSAEGEEKTMLDPEKESRVQDALIGIRKRFGKNAILRGTDLKEGATAMDRNDRVGGHKA